MAISWKGFLFSVTSHETRVPGAPFKEIERVQGAPLEINVVMSTVVFSGLLTCYLRFLTGTP